VACIYVIDNNVVGFIDQVVQDAEEHVHGSMMGISPGERLLIFIEYRASTRTVGKNVLAVKRTWIELYTRGRWTVGLCKG
jgi:hypothetical protein